MPLAGGPPRSTDDARHVFRRHRLAKHQHVRPDQSVLVVERLRPDVVAEHTKRREIAFAERALHDEITGAQIVERRRRPGQCDCRPHTTGVRHVIVGLEEHLGRVFATMDDAIEELCGSGLVIHGCDPCQSASIARSIASTRSR